MPEEIKPPAPLKNAEFAEGMQLRRHLLCDLRVLRGEKVFIELPGTTV